MSRPVLLDLFCGAGGCAVGYHRAGFDAVGVDLYPQKNYPFAFIQANAIEAIRALLRCGGLEDGSGRVWMLSDFDAIHASPPCQRYSVAGNIRRHSVDHPDLVAPTRVLLIESGMPWVIENVPGSPLIHPAMLCGLAFGLRVKRHRMFEASFPLIGTKCPKGHPGDWVTVFGGGAPATPDNRRRASAAVGKAAMGVGWMTREEMSQAIPPAYTEFVGRQLLTAVEAARG